MPQTRAIPASGATEDKALSSVYVTQFVGPGRVPFVRLEIGNRQVVLRQHECEALALALLLARNGQLAYLKPDEYAS